MITAKEVLEIEAAKTQGMTESEAIKAMFPLHNSVQLDMLFINLGVEELEAEFYKSYKKFDRLEDTIFGQVVMMEKILAMKDAPVLTKGIECIILMYRPNEESSFDNTNQEAESATRNLLMNSPKILIDKLLGKILESRESFFYNKYNGVIYAKPEKKEEIKKVKDSNALGGITEAAEVVSSEAEEFKSNFVKLWFWYERQLAIAEDFRCSPNDVLEINTDEVFVHLAYKRMKDILEQYKSKQS